METSAAEGSEGDRDAKDPTMGYLQLPAVYTMFVTKNQLECR